MGQNLKVIATKDDICTSKFLQLCEAYWIYGIITCEQYCEQVDMMYKKTN